MLYTLIEKGLKIVLEHRYLDRIDFTYFVSRKSEYTNKNQFKKKHPKLINQLKKNKTKKYQLFLQFTEFTITRF